MHEMPRGQTPKRVHKHKQKRDGLNSHCKPCHRAGAAAWRRANPDHWREYYRANAKHRREHIRAKREADPVLRRLIDGACKARKLGCVVEKFDSNDLELFWLCNGISTTRCHYCNVELGDGWHTDHGIPLSRGGPHAVTNIYPSCASCNVAKGQRTQDEYRKAVPA